MWKMINLNYYLYFYAIFAISTNSAYVLTQFDSYTDLIVTGIEFVNFNHANHPMEYCKARVGNDAIWIGYYDDVIPSNICRRPISCRANDVPDQEFIGVYPGIGVRCQRRTQNEKHNFGYGCYDGLCLPITCMDENCWRSHRRNQEEDNKISLAQNTLTPTDHSGRRQSLKKKPNQYSYTSGSLYRPPPTYSPSPQRSDSSSYQQPRDVDSEPQNPSLKGQIIRFDKT